MNSIYSSYFTGQSRRGKIVRRAVPRAYLAHTPPTHKHTADSARVIPTDCQLKHAREFKLGRAFRISETDTRISKTTALIALTDNANRILDGRTETAEAGSRSAEALLAIELTADLRRSVASGRINRLLQSMRGEDSHMEGYATFWGILIYAMAAQSPALHAQRGAWKRLIKRSRLFGITYIKNWLG